MARIVSNVAAFGPSDGLPPEVVKKLNNNFWLLANGSGGGGVTQVIERDVTVSVDVNSTTTLQPGVPATVVNVGTPQEVLLDFGIPQGPQGEQGPQGPQGPVGPQGPDSYGLLGIPVPLEQGGTGVTDAAAARLALGCASQADLDMLAAAQALYLPLSGGTLTGGLRQDGGTIAIKAATLDRDGTDPQSSGALWEDGRCLNLLDKDGYVVGRIRIGRSMAGTDMLQFLVWNQKADSSSVYGGFSYQVTKDGGKSFHLDAPLYEDGQNFVPKDTGFAMDTTPDTSDHWAPGLLIQDKDGNSWGQVREIRRTTGRNDLHLRSYGSNGTINYIDVGVNPDGTKYYGVSDAAKFRSDLGITPANIGAVAKSGNNDINGSLTNLNASFISKWSRLDRSGAAPTGSNTWAGGLYFHDVDGNVWADLRGVHNTDGRHGVRLAVYDKDGDVNGITLFRDNSGNSSFYLTDPAAFRTALGLDRTATVTTVSDIIEAAPGITITAASYTQRAGIAQLNVTAKGFSASTGTQSIGTVKSGKRPAFIRYEKATTSYATHSSLGSNGSMSVYWNTAPSPTTAYIFSFVYPLA